MAAWCPFVGPSARCGSSHDKATTQPIETTIGTSLNEKLAINMQKATKSQLKEVRELLRSKSARDEKRVFAAEGQKLVWDILSTGHAAESVLVSSKVLGAPLVKRIAEKAEGAGIPVFRVPAEEYENLSSLRSSQGVMGIVKMPASLVSADNILKDGPVVVLDGIQDPGNMGAMIRCAVAFGADGVILLGEAVDIYNPKVVRASSGTVLNARISAGGTDLIAKLKEKGAKLYASSCRGEGALPVETLGRSGEKALLAFGSEGAGLSKKLTDMADAKFHIPIDEKVESLNVTAAVAVTLYEFARKRG